MFAQRNFSLYGGHEDEINCLVFSLDLEILLTASINGVIRIWNTVYDHLTLKIDENAGLIRALTISKNDRYFASAANDKNIRLYQTRTGALLYTFRGHTHAVDCLQFSMDSQSVASGGWDCRTIVWNVVTGEQIDDFQHHTSAVQSIVFHPNMNLMATGSHDHIVYLYNFDQKPIKPMMLRGHFGNVRAVAFSHLPILASAGWDKIIVIWQIDMGRIRNRLFGHSGWIQAITFRNDDDGSTLASVDDDTVRVWNVLRGDCLHRLSIVNDLSCFVRFLPNNRGLLIGGAVYEFAADQWVPPRERPRTRRVRERVTGEAILMSKQQPLLPRRTRRDLSIKPPTLPPRPATHYSTIRKKIPVE